MLYKSNANDIQMKNEDGIYIDSSSDDDDKAMIPTMLFIHNSLY